MVTDAYKMAVDQVYKALGVSQSGLDASKAADRLKESGPNTLQRKKRISPFKIFFSQFQDVLIIVLMIAAVLSLVLAKFEEGGNFNEGLLIFGIKGINFAEGKSSARRRR
jgi:Ca2+-transporting ATPase